MTEEVDVPALIKIVKEQWRKERDRATLMETSFSEQCKYTDELNKKLAAERESVDQLDVLNTGLIRKNEELTNTIVFLRKEPGIQGVAEISGAFERALELAQERADKAETRAEELAAANRDLHKLFAEVEGLKSDKAKLNVKLSAEVTRSEELTVANSHLRTDCKAYSATIKDLNSYIDSVRKSLTLAMSRADKVKAELDELRAERGPAFPPDGVTRTEYGMIENRGMHNDTIRLVGTGRGAKAIATHSREVTVWPSSTANDFWPRYISAWSELEKVVLDG